MNRSEVMLGYLPLYYHSSGIIKAMMGTEGEEFDLLVENLEDLKAQFFVDTATWGLDLWEKEYGLEVSPSLSPEERRSKIKGKIRGVGTVGRDLIKSISEAYVNGTVEVTYNGSIIVRFVDINGIPSNVNDLKQQIEDVKPAHLPLFFRYKYLVIKEMEQLKVNELEAMTLKDFEDYQ